MNNKERLTWAVVVISMLMIVSVALYFVADLYSRVGDIEQELAIRGEQLRDLEQQALVTRERQDVVRERLTAQESFSKQTNERLDRYEVRINALER